MLRVLGELAIERDGVVAPIDTGARGRALLGWLALHPGTHPRAVVAARLRPDVLDASARQSLRQATWSLRQALGDEVDALVDATRDRIGLRDGVEVDVSAFRRRRDSGDLEGALALCRGPLLAGIEEEWALAAREAHDAERAAVVAAIADRAEAAGDLDAALQATRRLAAEAPLSEDAHRRLLRRLARAGDRAAALEAHAGFRDRLRRELGVAPSAATRAVVDRLRADGAGAPAPGSAAAVVDGPAASPAATTAAPWPNLAGVPDALTEEASFVGRADALALLGESWAEARAGRTRVAAIAGEPGIGKTRLAARMAAVVRADGGLVLHGRSDEDLLAPFQPFAEALGPLGAGAPDAPTWAPGADAGAARYRAFEAVRAALAAAASVRPALLVLDDLHWADPSTLLLLRHLGRRLRHVRLLIVITYRDTEVDDGHPLAHALADLRRDLPVTTIALRGLEPDAVRALAGGWDAAELARRTGGNPFFIGELLRDRQEAGRADGVPEGVGGVVARRLARLGDETVAVLTVAAAFGGEPALSDLESLAGERALDAIERAAAAGLVIERDGGTRVAFRHALVREALLARLSGARRRRLHLRVGEALRDRHGVARAADVAQHLLAARPDGSLDAAVEWTLVAAAEASRRLAFEDAAELCRRALDAMRAAGEDRRAGEALLALGDALARAGAGDRATAAFLEAATRARERGDREQLARAALGAGGLALVVTFADERRVALLREALDGLGDGHDALRARLLARLAVEVYYADTGAADRLSVDALELARRLGDRTTEAYALTARRVAIWSPERAEERLAVADAIIEAARRAGDEDAELHGRNWRVVDLLELGRVDETRAEIAAFARQADAVGLPHHRWYVPLWQSCLTAMAGRWDDAERLTAQALALGRQAQDPNAENFAEIQRVTRLYESGRLDEIDVEAILADERRHAGWIPFLAGVCARTGREDQARAIFESVVADDLARIPGGANWHVIGDVIDAAWLLGDAERAKQLWARLSPHAHLVLVTARAVCALGSAEHYLGLAAETAGWRHRAAAHYERSIVANSRLGAIPRVAAARERLAALGVATPPG